MTASEASEYLARLEHDNRMLRKQSEALLEAVEQWKKTAAVNHGLYKSAEADVARLDAENARLHCRLAELGESA